MTDAKVAFFQKYQIFPCLVFFTDFLNEENTRPNIREVVRKRNLLGSIKYLENLYLALTSLGTCLLIKHCAFSPAKSIKTFSLFVSLFSLLESTTSSMVLSGKCASSSHIQGYPWYQVLSGPKSTIFAQYSYLHANNVLTKNQSGFRPGDSTTNQLLYLLDEIHQAFDSTKSFEVRAVFLDISKTFDKVWHDGLIFKLEQNGISGNILKLFQNYLSNRKQRVVLNGSYSDLSSVESGVPQGSVLGPLLFLVYINDLERNIKSNVKFFADDTMLFSIVKNPELSANDLNHDLGVIHQWAHQWKLEYNPDPTKQATEVLFSCKTSNPNHPHIMFNGTVVAKMNEQKHLGLILDSNLSFKKHINEKIIKAKKNLGIIKVVLHH